MFLQLPIFFALMKNLKSGYQNVYFADLITLQNIVRQFSILRVDKIASLVRRI